MENFSAKLDGLCLEGSDRERERERKREREKERERERENVSVNIVVRLVVCKREIEKLTFVEASNEQSTREKNGTQR